MKVKQIIKGNPDYTRKLPQDDKYLHVSEFFYDTIQGEGINTGIPAAFLRMQHCTMNCFWCDTREVWRYGNPYSFNELFQLMEGSKIIDQLNNGQHLILTGGSPLKQQDQLIQFLNAFEKRYRFLPYIEIENECTLMPEPEMINYVSCWNNSPKLASSGNPTQLRYQPKILKSLSYLQNSWFKFVVKDEDDIAEIYRDFINTDLISHSQIILMPLGGTFAELKQNREKVVDMAIENGFRYCTREHIVLWDKKTGI